MDFKNYFRLERFSLFNRYIYLVYIDALDYSADKVFYKNKIRRVKFMQEYYQLNSPYVIVTCRIKAKDLDKFIKSMEELRNNMLITGYRDYDDYCNEFNNKVMNKLKEI